jgi:hypothetical protein
MRQPGSTLLFLIVCAFCQALSWNARADNVRFPPVADPNDVTGADLALNDRATIVTRYNACGRELDYANYRHQQVVEDYDKQGEDLSSILIAKIAWLTDDRFSHLPCVYAMRVARPKNPDGTWVHATQQDFMVATLGWWIDTTTPSQCSLQTSLISLSSEDPTTHTPEELRVKFQVEPACLRQQVNEAIRAMVKDGQMGTTDLPCATSISPQNKGDFDVNVRELVRIFYMGTIPRREVLERSTIDYMYENLLAARGGLSDSSYSVLADCDDPAGDELGSPEDFADREYWYNELLDGISDFFKWLAELHIKIAGSAHCQWRGDRGRPVHPGGWGRSYRTCLAAHRYQDTRDGKSSPDDRGFEVSDQCQDPGRVAANGSRQCR